MVGARGEMEGITGDRTGGQSSTSVKGARVEVLGGSDDGSQVTFAFRNESHTLGNSLRYVLARMKEVEFVGYSVPHPSDDVMHLRVQTRQGRPATEVLVQGFSSLERMLGMIRMEFSEAVQRSCGDEDVDHPMGGESAVATRQ